VAYVPPGQVKKATMNLLPGSYYVVEAGTDQEDNSFAKAGGIRPLRVTGAASKAGLPSASTTITASEYSFGVPGGLKAGTATVRFENKGRQPHFLLAVPVAAGKTFDEAKAAFTSGGPPSGPPPVDFEKATGAEYLDGGKSLVTTMSFEKGTYLFACFLTDRGGGPPHVELGMIQEVKVS
jgi:plastocyanin